MLQFDLLLFRFRCYSALCIGQPRFATTQENLS